MNAFYIIVDSQPYKSTKRFISSLGHQLQNEHIKWKLKQLDTLEEQIRLGPTSHSKPPTRLGHLDQLGLTCAIRRTLTNKYSNTGDTENALLSCFNSTNLQKHDEFLQHTKEAVDEFFFTPSRELPVHVSNEPQMYTSVPLKKINTIEQPVWDPNNSISLKDCDKEQNQTEHVLMEAEYSEQWIKLQEARLRKTLEAKKAQWLTQQDIPNAFKTAKKLIEINQKWTEQQENLSKSGLFITSSYTTELEDTFSPQKWKELEEQQQRHNVLLDLQKKLREKRKQIGLQGTDKINTQICSLNQFAEHQQLRAIRLAALLRQYLTRIFSNLPTSFRFGVMKGADIAISKVYRRTPTSMTEVYYDILSNHSSDYVQERLALGIPYIRYQLGSQLNLPRVPELKFIYEEQKIHNESQPRHSKLANKLRYGL